MNSVLMAEAVSLALFAGMLLCLDLGFRLGRRAAQRQTAYYEGIGALEAAVYALLGLLLGFTFAGATSRFEAHRQLIVKEANAIGTAFLRVDELPAAQQPDMRRLFHDYLDTRLRLEASLRDQQAAEREMQRSAELQKEIWADAVAGSRLDPSQNSARLLLPALNEMFDVTTERSVVFRAHLPPLIFFLLIFIALMSALLAGYSMAKRKSRSLLHMFLYAACISATIYAVTDLEYPRSGLIRVDAAGSPLFQLRESMRQE